MPLLGEFKCHRVLIPALIGAMEELIARNLEFLIDAGAFRGCDNGRMIGGGRSLSRHSWGAAVDLNYSLEIAADPRLIAVMERWDSHPGTPGSSPIRGILNTTARPRLRRLRDLVVNATL